MPLLLFQSESSISLYIVTLVVVLTSLIFYLIQKARSTVRTQKLDLQQKLQIEREHIARDLHDHVGTQLSLINKSIDSLAGLSPADKDRRLADISLISKEVISTLRETIWSLNKKEITLEEFSDKLREYAQKQITNYSTLVLDYKATESIAHIILNPSEGISLFRICQEAISNALKYANAKTLTISVGIKNGHYHIVINDNGQGFNHLQENPLKSYGLENMKFRAQQLGYTLLIKSVAKRYAEISLSKKIMQLHPISANVV